MPSRNEQLQFALAIEEIVLRHRYNYVEAIIHHCQATGLEIDVAAQLVNETLREKIAADAQELNLMKLKRGAKLPL